MPELVEQMYCSQQIVIPPNFPYILKKYAKAAIKTQPYDLLRWSFEYFRALADKKTPPVKLRLEYPVFNTEGGLTRGYLKVLANQLSGMEEVPIPILRSMWQGSCLDMHELRRILCLCEVYLRQDTVPRLHFLAVAGGLLTKSLTHTMILLCETLTHEPDGGSAAIALHTFMSAYVFLARVDATANVKYINGYREGATPEDTVTEEEEETVAEEATDEGQSLDSFWVDNDKLKMLTLINDNVPMSHRLSMKLNMPIIGKLERTPSVERASKIERENYSKERRARLSSNPDIDEKLRAMSSVKFSQLALADKEDGGDAKVKEKIEEKSTEKEDLYKIFVYDEDDQEVPYEIYGAPSKEHIEEEGTDNEMEPEEEAVVVDSEPQIVSESAKIAEYVNECYDKREERLQDLITTFEEMAVYVDKFNAANYDLGVIAGRQMSATSGEFVAQYIERDIMDYINEQIAILPDPDLKKKKAKPEEVAMIKDLLETFLDENMDVIVPEVEEVEEEEMPIPEITIVYAVPGIGPIVEDDIMKEFLEYAKEVSKTQSELFMPRNIRHFMCPPLEKPIDPTCNDGYIKKVEEIPKEGTFTD